MVVPVVLAQTRCRSLLWGNSGIACKPLCLSGKQQPKVEQSPAASCSSDRFLSFSFLPGVTFERTRLPSSFFTSTADIERCRFVEGVPSVQIALSLSLCVGLDCPNKHASTLHAGPNAQRPSSCAGFNCSNCMGGSGEHLLPATCYLSLLRVLHLPKSAFCTSVVERRVGARSALGIVVRSAGEVGWSRMRWHGVG